MSLSSFSNSIGTTAPLMVSPAFSLGPAVESGSDGISETYFSPNSVLGTIWAVTSAGTSSMSSGFMPSVKLTSSPTTFTSRTSPTIMPAQLDVGVLRQAQAGLDAGRA